MKQFLGNYLGIVIQNNDPEKRGRCKIFIPHASAALYNSWYSNTTEDKHFRFPGAQAGVKTSLTKEIMDDLKEIIPWAECASPIIGSQGAGRYNAFNDTGSISDTNKLDTFVPGVSSDSEYELNSDGIGESPGRKYELQKLKLYDAFTKSDSEIGFDDPNRVNFLSYNYTPNTYSNKTKGAFSVPNVGAHIWVFFREGDPMNPIYFAASHGYEDWKGIYDSNIDYPGTFENKSDKDDAEEDINTETYRNKFVFNQKGGAFEFVNTDNRELLKLTHYSGSFKEFNNFANVELASKNDQKLVLEDQFLTVNGYGNYYVGRDSDNLIKGDQYIKIGKLDKGLHDQWRETARELAIIKQLFEIQRTPNIHAEADAEFAADQENNQPVIFRKTSILQQLAGDYAPCPVCNDSSVADYYWSINNRFNSVSVGTFDSTTEQPTDFATTSITTSPATYDQVLGGGQIYNKSCPVCSGTGISPSSMNGTWSAEPKKAVDSQGNGEFGEKVKEVVTKLKDIEKQLGLGGSQVIKIAKHKIETIGLAMNDFGSIRVDTAGKMYRDSVVVHPHGTFNSQKESPLVEYVHVDDLPGGTFTQNIGNKWNVQVGAGGVSMKSYGPVDIGGTIVNMAGEQVNVSSQSEVNIDGGKRLTMVADILTLRQRNRKQVLVDSNLGVSQNVVIGGGMHVEGELSLNHVTAPCEIQETELTRLFAKLLTGLSFEATLDSDFTLDEHGAIKPSTGTITLTTDSNDNKVQCYDHSHNFKNLPLHLKSTNEGVRQVGEKCNNEKRAEAAAIENKSAADKVSP